MSLRIIKIALFCLIFLLLSCANKSKNKTDNSNDFLKITMTYNGQREVLYKKWDSIEVRIELKNISNVDVGVPIEYLDEIGVTASLYDDKSRTFAHAFQGGMSDGELLKKFTILHPGESAIFIDNLDGSYFKEFHQTRVDLSLGTVIRAIFQANNQVKDLVLTDSIPVIDIKKIVPLK